MKILITGGKGLLGNSLLKTADYKTHKIVWTYFRNPPQKSAKNAVYLDLNNQQNIEEVFDNFKPDWVIHTAGNGSVDWCEKNKEEAYRINVEGTENIIFACKKHKSQIVYISSNAVFDGNNPLYKEDDLATPVNFYGHTKIICEHIVKAFIEDFVIVRPILMYGWDSEGERSNPVTWLIHALEERKTVKIVDDIYINPLYAMDCANGIWRIIEIKKTGTYNFAGKDCMSRYEMAIQTAKAFGLDENLIQPVKNAYFKYIAPRPCNTSYNTGKMEKELGIKPRAFAEGLLFMKKEIE
ncbi:MAG: SDR family oxidoreductase [Deltaproteobacteria bacterium]|nr:SDR family oxidoreductase [Deltaproteobacteria bacterium]